MTVKIINCESIVCPICKKIILNEKMEEPKYCKHVLSLFNDNFSEVCYSKTKKIKQDLKKCYDAQEFINHFKSMPNVIVHNITGAYCGCCTFDKDIVAFKK
jgi:hypothetical protein